MPDHTTALTILRAAYPQARIGLDNDRPYARTPDGILYGILGEAPGDRAHGRQPVAIIRFPSGALSARNYEIVRWLEPAGARLTP